MIERGDYIRVYDCHTDSEEFYIAMTDESMSPKDGNIYVRACSIDGTTILAKLNYNNTWVINDCLLDEKKTLKI
jgi:hypothetical protein